MYRQRTDGKSVALKMVEHNVVRAWSRNPRENNTPTPSRGDLCVQYPRMINQNQFENVSSSEESIRESFTYELTSS